MLNLDIMHYAKVNHHFTLPAITVPPSEVSLPPGTYCEDLGLIWIDAHPDINTDKTTVTGNIHGMPVAALIGMGEQSLTRILSDKPKVKPSNIVMLGLRDIDPPEMAFLNKLHIRYYTWQQMATLGIPTLYR